MKRLLMLLAILALPAILLAQHISVASFRALPTDMTARITDPVKDQNGDKCALIKVVTTETDFAWEGGMLGVMKAEKKKGEYWVYVPYGAKKLTIKHDKLGVLRNYLYPEPIEEATVYEMVLTTGKVTTIVEEYEIPTQWVIIESEPAGANVYLNDQHKGVTPFQLEMEEGHYTYRIDMPLYHPEAGVFDLAEADGKKRMNISLKPNFGYVQINTSPESGATVYIDGQLKPQKSPMKTDRLKSGTHHVKVEKSMFYPAEQEVVVEDGQTITANLVLKPAFGSLRISYSPTDASVYLDGKLMNAANPLTLDRINSGTHTLRIEKQMYYTDEQTISIADGENKDIAIELKPAFGGVYISSSPESGAKVLLDGNPTGKTTPCTLERLSSGEHTISLQKEWYQPSARRINLKDGESANLEIVMQPTFGTVEASTIEGADIYVDGERKSSENWNGRLIAGFHTIEARKDKHHSDKQKTEVLVGETHPLSLHPQPKQGNLKIVTNPFDAQISLNGTDYGLTPNTIKDLLIGDYQLSLSKEGYGTFSKTISIAEGETLEINEELPSGKEITINSEPSGATLSIDGQNYGTTPWTGTLAFGSHNIKLQNGKKIINEQITISQNGQSSFSYDVSEFGENFTETVNGISFTMVAVKGGCFNMGNNNGRGNEKPVHKVCVDDFYMGETEVTQALWEEVMGYNPSPYKEEYLPVMRVSWNDIQEFLQELNILTGETYGLPTEAEWEYAARGGLKSKGYKYAGSDNIDDIAWYADNSGGKPNAVGTTNPNELGLYDMSGNVREWCNDWNNASYYRISSQNNPPGASSGNSRILRGGYWSDNADWCTVSNRIGGKQDYAGDTYGFRIVLRSTL